MQPVLIARDGYIYTNGEIYGKQIHLGEGLSEFDFYLISEEDFQALEKKKATQAGEFDGI